MLLVNAYIVSGSPSFHDLGKCFIWNGREVNVLQTSLVFTRNSCSFPGVPEISDFFVKILKISVIIGSKYNKNTCNPE